jgi:hypothetical protein
MDAVFTLPYPEYIVATHLQRLLKKKEGYSVQIPLSRQQKGIDLLVYSARSRKAVSIQIKSSRAYLGKAPKRKSKRKRFNNALWFVNFDYQKDIADFYILFGLYPKSDIISKRLDKSKKTRKWWDYKILVFTDKEIRKFLRNLLTRRGKKESFFGFGFNNRSKDIFATRGVKSPKSVKEYLIENKIATIIDFLK